MKSRYLPLFAVLIAAQSTTTAATWTWNGNTSGGWGVNTNWVGNVVPTFDNTADLVFGATPIVNHLTFLGNGPRTVRSISCTGTGITSPLEIRTSDNGTVGRILHFSADAGNASLTIDSSVNQTVNIGASTVGNVNLVSDLSINHNGSGLLTISRPVSESSAGRSITKSGTGTLLLSAANTFTGTTTVNGGILRIGNAAALGATAGGTVVNAGGTLDLNGIKLGAAEPVSIVGNGHGGIGAIYQTTGNTGDANSFPAGLTLTGNVSVGAASGARFGVGGNANALSTSGPFTLTKVGAGQFDLRGAVSVGDIIVNEGFLQTQGGGSYNAGTITVNPGAEFRIFEYTGTFERNFILNSGRLASTGSVDFTGDTISSNVTLNGACVIQSTGGVNDRFILTGDISESTAGSSVTIGGDRRVVFAGTNTYTGPTNLNFGTLQADGTFTSDIIVASGATLDGEGETTGSVTFGNNSNLTFNPATTGGNEFLRAADVIVSPGDTVTVRPSAAGTISEAVVLRDGNGGLDLANFVLFEPGRATLGLGGEGGDSDLIYSLNAANLEWRALEDDIWDTQDIVAMNFQNLDTSVPDVFYSYDNVDFTDAATGPVTLLNNITAGNVVFKNTDGNDVELIGGVTLSSTGIATTSSGNVLITPTIIGSTPITVGGTGALILAGNNTSVGAITVNSGTLQIGDGGSTGSVAAGIANDGNVTFNRSTNLTTNSVISGSGTLTQAGTAATILTGENTYTGLTTITSGTLEIGAGPTGSIVGDILNNAALIINRGNAYTHVGNITGTGTLRKNSGGETTLIGTNTFSGGLIINNGTITGADSALGSGTIHMGANLVFNITLKLANGTTVDNPIVLTDIGGNKVLDVVDGVGNTATISGPITINTNVTDAVRLGVDPGETLIISGDISGTGTAGLAKRRNGTVILTGVNTYAGETRIIDSGAFIINSNVPGDLVFGEGIGGGGFVTNGIVGGTGVIGGNLLPQADSNIAPGHNGAGTLSVNGNANLALLAGGVGRLHMELAALAATSDRLAVTGTVALGTDALGLSDFVFTNLGGLEAGAYTLITSGGLTGTLDPADLSGEIAPGISGTLSISGNDVILTVSSGSPYDTWVASFPGLTNPAFDFDFDNDGIPTGLEWILGGNPTLSDSASITPVITASSVSGITLTFTREEDSIGVATLMVEYGTDLATFPGSIQIDATSSGPDANGVTVAINDASDPDEVTVNIPASNTVGGKLFTRLKATLP